MKLFYSINSPFARKCRIVILEKGLQGQVEFITVDTAAPSAELLAVNPLGRIPALVLEDGTNFCESPVICEYLDSLSQQNPIYPNDNFKAQRLAAMASGLMDSAVSLILESRRPEQMRFAPWVERKTNAVKNTIAQIAKFELDANAKLDIGIISTVAALDYVSFRFPQIEWRSLHPQLAQWLDIMGKRPSFAETAPQ